MEETRSKVALITGITGQDGSYLCEFLLEKGYTVHGIVRRSSSVDTVAGRIYKNRDVTGAKIFLHYGDLCDPTDLLASIISKTQPTEIYNLGAMSQVSLSFDKPEYTADCDGVGVLRMLSAIRAAGMENKVRFYQASSSELYGGQAAECPQSETTPFYPRSPYAVAKLYAFWILVNYREAYGMHVSNGILFNHESPRRPGNFVTRKITTGVAHIVEGLQETLYLGNLNASRDWGHARDFIEGMWLMLQQEEAGDYVLASGESHSVREFVECAFKYAGVSIKWLGPSGTVDEIGVEEGNEGRVMVAVDPRFFRPTECNMVQGDPTKAKTKLGWVSKTSFDGLVNEMMEADLALVKEEVKASESRTVGESRIEKSTSATFEACRSTKSSFITIDEESTYTVENPTPSKNQRAFHVLSNENQGEDDIRDVLSTELSNDNQGEDEKREEATVA